MLAAVAEGLAVDRLGVRHLEPATRPKACAFAVGIHGCNVVWIEWVIGFGGRYVCAVFKRVKPIVR